MKAVRMEAGAGKGRSIFFFCGAWSARCDKWTESTTGVSCVTQLSLASLAGLCRGDVNHLPRILLIFSFHTSQRSCPSTFLTQASTSLLCFFQTSPSVMKVNEMRIMSLTASLKEFLSAVSGA